jgi:hypothetical protein
VTPAVEEVIAVQESARAAVTDAVTVADGAATPGDANCPVATTAAVLAAETVLVPDRTATAVAPAVIAGVAPVTSARDAVTVLEVVVDAAATAVSERAAVVEAAAVTVVEAAPASDRVAVVDTAPAIVAVASADTVDGPRISRPSQFHSIAVVPGPSIV